MITDSQARSISHETTFAENISDLAVIKACLLQLTEQVAWRLRRASLAGRTVQLKLRYPDFKTLTRSHTHTEATNNTDQLWQITRRLLRENWSGTPALRLLGMGVSGLQGERDQPSQADLFAPVRQQDGKLDQLTDRINERFAPRTLQRGRSKQRITE